MGTGPRTRRVLGRFAAAILLFLFCGSSFQPAAVQGQSPVGQAHQAEAQGALKHDTSKPLKEMPKIKPKDEGVVLGKKLLPNRVGSKGKEGDDALQAEATPGAAAPSSAQNFEGINNVNGVLPPDTNGDIGPNHYVQMVNLAFAIWDRNGTLVYGPANINTLWQGFGGACETTNDGDPIVLYDHLADRWMLSQFALPNYPSGPFYQCIAVSQTGDPTGAYHRYQFLISNNKLNDYPKFGVWPDGYYMSINQFACNFFGCSWAGQGAVVFERDQMLNGLPARGVKFDLFGVDPNLGGMLPADLDGPTPPPAGAPNPFCLIDDDAWGYSGDQIQCWDFHVDWTNPAASTFALHAALPTAAFDSNMCGYARNCIPQPGTTAKVDAISDRLMYRLQYRNFGTHQTLVTNHTVDVNGTDRAGIRWYELRNAGGGWSIHQQGTYSADSAHRWMGSIAMNGIGDIGLGYSISSSTVFPSIRVTGRLDGDAPGTITQGEVDIATGTGHQTHSASRWGDYSQMAVDPTDDCTFWYTQEYYALNSVASWQTRVGAFKLRACGPADNPPTVSIANPAEGATVSGAVQIEIIASDTEDAAGSLTVEWNIDGGAWQPATYNGVDRYLASWDTTSVAEGGHTVNARATDSASQTATDSNAVTVDNDNPPAVNIATPAEGATVSGTVQISIAASDAETAAGSLTVEWTIDGGVWQPALYDAGLDRYIASWDSPLVADGPHTVNARATDSASQTATDSNAVTVDNVNAVPTVSIATPAEGATVSGTVQISIAASDAEDAAGSLIVEWNIDGGVWQPALYNAGLDRYVASWDTTGVTDGNHTVNARATDSASQTATDSNAVTVENVNAVPTAAFTYACPDLTCDFDAASSSDSDGTITGYAWNFGDGATGSGQTASHAYAAAGTYIVTLTATDNGGATDSESKSVTVTSTTHVGDLDRSSTNQGSRWTAFVTISVHNGGHGAVAGATVSGTWSNGATETSSCTTNAAGQCSVNKPLIRKQTHSVTFTVNSVTHASRTYTPASNHDPDGDSNGTTITVLKP